MTNESIPLYRPGTDVTGHAAGGVAGATFVEVLGLDGALPAVRTCPAGGVAFGVAVRDSDARSNRVTVMRGPNIVLPVLAGGTISAGSLVEVGPGGSAVTASGTSPIAGRALDNGAAGQPVYVDLWGSNLAGVPGDTLAAVVTPPAGLDAAAVQALIDARLAAATAPLLARIAALETGKADLSRVGVNALGQAFATRLYTDVELFKKTDKTTTDAAAADMAALADKVDAIDPAYVAAVETQLNDYMRANDVKVSEALGNTQSIFDAFAGRPGGTTRQIEDFLANLAAWIGQTGPKLKELTDTDVALAEYVATRTQAILDAMNGPNATIESITAMFRLLNDVIVELAAATGITLPDGTRMVGEGSNPPPSVMMAVANDAAPLAAARQAEVRALLTGGVEVPPNVDWIPLTGSTFGGSPEVRLINGWVQLRGELKWNVSAVGSYTKVRTLPPGIPAPTSDHNATVWAIDTGITYRIGTVRITTTGNVELSAPTGKYDGVTLNGVTYPVF